MVFARGGPEVADTGAEVHTHVQASHGGAIRDRRTPNRYRDRANAQPHSAAWPNGAAGPDAHLPGHCRRPYNAGDQLPATKRRHESRFHRDRSFAARTRQRHSQGKKGYIDIDAKFDQLAPPTQFGPEYLTYVLWAITPEGRATNLGEVQVKDDEARVHVTHELQAFGMIVTAEPYFAVTQPSDVVVIENSVRITPRATSKSSKPSSIC